VIPEGQADRAVMHARLCCNIPKCHADDHVNSFEHAGEIVNATLAAQIRA